MVILLLGLDRGTSVLLFILSNLIDFAFPEIYRSCVGRHVANNSLFIDISTILWAMKIIPVKDDHGNPIIPNVGEEVTDGITLYVLRFLRTTLKLRGGANPHS